MINNYNFTKGDYTIDDNYIGISRVIKDGEIFCILVVLKIEKDNKSKNVLVPLPYTNDINLEKYKEFINNDGDFIIEKICEN